MDLIVKEKTRQCRRCRQTQKLNDLTVSIAYGVKRYYCSEGCESAYKLKKKSLSASKKTSTNLIDVTQPETDKTKAIRYVVTSAQNNTRVKSSFLKSLLFYCKQFNAKLLVIPYLYRNPTSPNEDLKEVWYDSRIIKYLLRDRLNLEGFSIAGNLSINPTAVNPLSGLEAISSGKTMIVPHPQIALKCIPTPRGKLPLILTTTGAITEKNYSQSKAGIKGEFHHSFGACVIETKGTKFHVRNLSATSQGDFTDLGMNFTATKMQRQKLEALVMGDLHIGSTSLKVTQATQRMIDTFSPRKIVLHDSLDGEQVNPHVVNDPFHKFNTTYTSLEDELSHNARVLKHYAERCEKLVVVKSNHDDFLYRWLKTADWKTLSTKTAKIYLEMCLRAIETKDSNVYAKEMLRRGVKANFLEMDACYTVEGIELGFHGHKGSNGSRGSAKQYSKTGMKTSIGHSHTPCIEKGCYQVGTSTHLVLDYTEGLSSWLNTHCFIYKGGKRQLIHIIDGEYTFE